MVGNDEPLDRLILLVAFLPMVDTIGNCQTLLQRLRVAPSTGQVSGTIRGHLERSGCRHTRDYHRTSTLNHIPWPRKNY